MKHNLVILCCLLFAFVSVATASCGLRCILASWPFILIPSDPNISSKFAIHSISCLGIQLDSLSASLSKPPSLSISLSSNGISSQNCSFQWSDENNSTTTSSLSVNITQVSMIFSLIKYPNSTAPIRSVLTSCFSNVSVLRCNSSSTELGTILPSILSKAVCDFFIQTTAALSASLPDIAQTISQYSQQQPLPINPDLPPDYAANFRQSSVVNVLEVALDDAAGPSVVSKVLERYTNYTGHAWANITGQAAGLLGGYVSLGNSDLFYYTEEADFENLQNWTSFDPIETEREDNQTIVAAASLTKLQVNASLRVEIAVRTPDSEGRDIGTFLQHGYLVFNLNLPSLLARARLFINHSALETFYPEQLVDWRCLLSSLKFADVQQAIVNVSSVNFASISLVLQSSDVEEDLLPAINDIAELISRAYSNSFVGLTNGYWAPSVLEPLRIVIQTMLANDWECNLTTPGPETPYLSIPWVIWTISIASGSFILLTIIVISISCYRNNKNEFENDCSSLMMNSKIPIAVRYFIPFVLFSNAAAFVCSTASIGATVLPIIKLGNDEIRLSSVFNFGLANTINSMWDAKVYPLAILIALFSGAWPYGKLLAMLICWILPPKALAVRKREQFLMLLDALGKWSLIDLYCFVLFAVAFRFHIEIDPRTKSQSLSLGSTIDLFVVSQIGFVLFVLATVGSLVIGHCIVALHRFVGENANSDQTTKGTEPNESTTLLNQAKQSKYQPLFSQAWEESECVTGIWRTILRISIPLLLIFSIFLVIAGVSATCVEFDIQGAAGWGLSLLGQNPPRKYSLMDIGKQFRASSTTPNGCATLIVVAVFMVTSVAVPFLHLLVLLVLWLCPMTFVYQKRWYVLAEVFNAWSAIEVFTVSIIAAMLQISQFTSFMVKDHCDSFAEYLKQYLDEDSCFSVIAKISDGSWVLLSGCVCYVASAMVVMRCCHSIIHTRVSQANNMSKIN